MSFESMRALVTASPRPVGPVTQFALLLVPIVMNCFLFVYTVLGWIIDGRDKLNWSIEAGGVALWVGLGVPFFAVLVIAWVRLRGGRWRHPLVLSSVGHGVLALLLALAIVIARQA